MIVLTQHITWPVFTKHVYSILYMHLVVIIINNFHSVYSVHHPNTLLPDTPLNRFLLLPLAHPPLTECTKVRPLLLREVLSLEQQVSVVLSAVPHAYYRLCMCVTNYITVCVCVCVTN